MFIFPKSFADLSPPQSNIQSRSYIAFNCDISSFSFHSRMFLCLSFLLLTVLFWVCQVFYSMVSQSAWLMQYLPALSTTFPWQSTKNLSLGTCASLNLESPLLPLSPSILLSLSFDVLYWRRVSLFSLSFFLHISCHCELTEFFIP